MNQILNAFKLDAPVASCERYGCGHVNETYLVVSESGRRYILQKINNNIFKMVVFEIVFYITNIKIQS